MGCGGGWVVVRGGGGWVAKMVYGLVPVLWVVVVFGLWVTVGS